MKSNKANRAKSLLTHYFRMASQGEWRFDSDNVSEIEEIVDLIVDAAVEEIKAEIREQVTTDEPEDVAFDRQLMREANAEAFIDDHRTAPWSGEQYR
jgi:hypothetical protein